MPRSTVFSRRLAALGGAVALAVGTVAFAPRPAPKEPVCAKDNGGLVLAPGLCATLFAADVAGTTSMMGVEAMVATPVRSFSESNGMFGNKPAFMA